MSPSIGLFLSLPEFAPTLFILEVHPSTRMAGIEGSLAREGSIRVNQSVSSLLEIVITESLRHWLVIDRRDLGSLLWLLLPTTYGV